MLPIISKDGMSYCVYVFFYFLHIIDSHRRAQEATKAGKFHNEIISLPGKSKSGEDVHFSQDEGIRPSTTTAEILFC